MIVRKFGPPLLAGESASCGGHFASIVFPFTHNALPYIDCIKKKQSVVTVSMGSTDLCDITDVSLTLLLIKITVHVSLHFCIGAITHPGQMFTGDNWTSLIVESSNVEKYFHVKALYFQRINLMSAKCF